MKASELKTGYFIRYYIPFHPLKPLSWLHLVIRIVQGWFTHAGLVVKSWGVPFIHEAKATGIRSFTVKKSTAGKFVQVWTIRELTKAEEKRFCIMATSLVGTVKYDFLNTFIHQPIYWITRHINRIFTGRDVGIWLGAKQKNPSKHQNCSEHPATMWSHFHEIPAEFFRRVSPQKLSQLPGAKLLFEGYIEQDLEDFFKH